MGNRRILNSALRKCDGSKRAANGNVTEARRQRMVVRWKQEGSGR